MKLVGAEIERPREQGRGWFSEPVKEESQGGTCWEWTKGLVELMSLMRSDERHCGALVVSES